MFGLALHTSTPELGLTISDFEQLHRHQTWDLGRDLSSQLHARLQAFLAPQHWQDLTLITVCVGPGGFTGTRIGVATARTLAQQLEVPLVGISALAAIAHHSLSASEQLQKPADIAVTMPAKRGAVYGGIYRWTGDHLQSALADAVFTADDWQLQQSQWPQALTQVSVEAGIGLAETTPSLLQLGYEQWQKQTVPGWREVTPFYGQHPVTV